MGFTFTVTQALMIRELLVSYSGNEISIGLILGSSMLFDVLSQMVLGVDPDSVTVLLHPIALAGWFGFFVTFLNLLPISASW